MNSLQKFSFVLIAAALILSPVAKAGDEPVTNNQAMKAAPAVAENPSAADASSGQADKTLLAKPVAKCDGAKTCKTGKCACKSKKHCKYCKGMKKKEHADAPPTDSTEATSAPQK